MSDINLLPEDLKKKQEKTLKNRGDFDLDEIEFTEGEKLKKHIDAKANISKGNKIGRWFKPQSDNKTKFNKNYNKVNSTNFVSKINNKQKKLKKKLKSKKDINNLKKISPSIDETNVKIDKEINNKQKEKQGKSNALNSSIKSEKSKLSNQETPKVKKNNFNLKSLIDKFKEKFNKKRDKKEKKDKDFDVNLLPFGSNVPTTRKMISSLIITFILSSSLIFIVYFGYYIYKEKIIENYSVLEKELDVYMEDIKKYDDLMRETSAWQEKIIKIENLLNKHIYWTKFLEKLEENTLPNVQFVGFAGSTDTTITLEAIAPDYQTISKQWIRLENANDFVEKVEIDGASMSTLEDSINISFSLTLDFVDGIFYKE